MRRIHLDKGFFGTDVGTISDDGKILIPGGIWGDKIAGFFEDDGIYIPDGLHKKKIVDLYPDGSLHLTEDAGTFHRGTRIGSVDPDGTLRNTDGRKIGTLEKPSYDRKPDRVDAAIGADRKSKDRITVPPPRPGRFGDLLGMVVMGGFVLLIAGGAVVLLPALLGSDQVTGGSKLFILTVTGVSLLSSFVVSGLTRGESFGDTWATALAIAWVITTLAFIWLIAVFDKPTGIELALVTIPGIFICLGWSAAASAVSTSFVFLIRLLKNLDGR